MSQIEPQIRLAQLADTARIARLCEQLGYSVSVSAIEERLQRLSSDRDQVIYVADLPDQPVVGWIQVRIVTTLVVGRQAEIHGLIVDETYRGFGIGRLLTRQVEYWAQRQFCHVSVVRSNVLREAAHDFYKKLNYAPLKTQFVFRKALSDFDCR